MITVREYLGLRGRNPWEEWFENLDAPQQAPVPVSETKQVEISYAGDSAPAAHQGETPPSQGSR